MTNESREELIRLRGRLMEECYGKAESDGNNYFLWMGEAQAHQNAMRDLIAGRCPDFVRSLEVQRGLV